MLIIIMEKMTQNMERLTNSIADGFNLLRQFMTYQHSPSTYPSQSYNPYIQGSQMSYATSGYHSPTNNHSYDDV